MSTMSSDVPGYSVFEPDIFDEYRRTRVRITSVRSARKQEIDHYEGD